MMLGISGIYSKEKYAGILLDIKKTAGAPWWCAAVINKKEIMTNTKKKKFYSIGEKSSSYLSIVAMSYIFFIIRCMALCTFGET